jgi:hypothetical protein
MVITRFVSMLLHGKSAFRMLQLEDVIKMHNNVNNVGEARHIILDGYTLGFQMLELA